ncbi:MAG: phosphate ABC transporter permease PstA [Gammaproteobacteria bacterium]|nr:phosphate ABC transporter permease PstA [Gammaproteobacteria bacterium]
MSRAEQIVSGLARRQRAEKRFRAYGITAILLGMSFLVLLFTSIIANGYQAFTQTYIELPIYFDPEVIDPNGDRDPQALFSADYWKLVKTSMYQQFPQVSGRSGRREVTRIMSGGSAFDLRERVIENPDLIGTTQRVWLVADDDIDMLMKGYIDREVPEDERRLNDRMIGYVDTLDEAGIVERKFNTTFFTAGDSREPEQAGILGALMGSFLTLIVTLLLSFPIGVAAAIYLEEFAPRNRFIDLIEININNLAAVPSIIFGLLGLAIFINWFGMPRSTPVVGGLVLTLMTLPTIIIASRVSIQAVPPSIKEAALGVGASRMQAMFHHVLPIAMPGMLTGTIIGMAQALGESAPLLMIGMVAFIVEPPSGFTDPATALPVQIYLWSDSPERGFTERTSAAILVLLAFLVTMNATAVYLRKKIAKRF